MRFDRARIRNLAIDDLTSKGNVGYDLPPWLTRWSWRSLAATVLPSLLSTARLMRCKQFNAKLSTTIGLSLFFLSFFFFLFLKQSLWQRFGREHRPTRYNRNVQGGPSAACSLRTISFFSVSNETRRRVGRDFIGKRTESKTILYGTFLPFQFLRYHLFHSSKICYTGPLVLSR